MKRSLFGFSLLSLAPLSGLAQELADAAPAAVSTVESAAVSPTLKQLFVNGGPLMWVLLAISIFAIAVTLYLFCILSERVTAPRKLVSDVCKNLQNGAFDEARRLCSCSSSAFSRIATAAIDAAYNLSDVNDTSVLGSVVAGEGTRQAERLQARAQWLLDIASISPMVGLLGTVLGMLQAFNGVAGDFVAAAKPVVLANGVSVALITTVAGLVIAIPCMVFYAVFRRIASRQVAVLERHASDVVMIILNARRFPNQGE